jgi:hypothetical protein
MPLQHLVYISMVNGAAPTCAELQGILAQSVRNNRRLGVTGVLLYAHGGFMQVLEGEAATVAALFEHIQQDKRHCRITVLLDQPIAQRSFGDWAMVCRCLRDEAVQALPEDLAPLFHHGFDLSRLRARPGVALELLKHYSLNNGLVAA